METYTIGQAADRSGFTASALRFYERHGIVEPVARTRAGYRLYDEGSLARLQFVERAKQLGCSLEEISALVQLVERDECGPVQARLHELVTAKIAEARARSAELQQFAADLQTAADRLGGAPVDGPCGEHCACVAGAPTSGDAPVGLDVEAATIACTLPAEDVPRRVDDWRGLLGFVQRRDPLPGGVRLSLHPEVPLDQLTRLVTAEQRCCAFFAFAVTVDQRGIALEVQAPEAAGDVIDSLFGGRP